jgi:hypothetical protein
MENCTFHHMYMQHIQPGSHRACMKLPTHEAQAVQLPVATSWPAQPPISGCLSRRYRVHSAKSAKHENECTVTTAAKNKSLIYNNKILTNHALSRKKTSKTKHLYKYIEKQREQPIRTKRDCLHLCAPIAFCRNMNAAATAATTANQQQLQHQKQ